MKNNRDILTTGEVARYCGVTLRTVINWINKGLLVSHQLPGTRKDNRIMAKDLVAFMNENAMPVPDELAHAQKNNRAMIVDDDKLLAKSLARTLSAHGFDVTIAHDGFEAGLKYNAIKPALMFLDLQMPRVSGYSVLEQLRDRKNCKIIVYSGMGEDALNKALSLGADFALAKPFDEDELKKVIAE